eukprot:gene9182-10836_t
MPQYVLKIKADLENIKQLIPLPDNHWELTIQSADGCDTKEGVTISKGDVMELEGSRGDANFIMKWPGNKQQAYIKIVDIKGVTGNYTEDQAGKWITVLGLECRGIVPTAWKVGRDFIAESSGGHFFEDVDLADGDWAEYDEENDASVSVTNVESKVE